ncbi:hypothetical protein BN8_03684 [Fibrisoma limi BUZ 3]|uniref:Bacteriophage T5 Orf172 DNA-binding domain-containing protein n=1 Tax=Fibrisoma limi BUZ 3 TaxID=1185876 RepID=I2GKT1_9BACT|nr:GIY-YIG nuclease family protein [Fibrisoma limi]CCH54507.1 hypothetical protein BN8_03684 [Fibrisoma limi BUZ 3]
MDNSEALNRFVNAIDESLTDSIYDAYVAEYDGQKFVANNVGYLYSHDALMALQIQLNQFQKIIDSIRTTYDTHEYNNLVNQVNEFRRAQKEVAEAEHLKRLKKQKSEAVCKVYLMHNKRTGNYKIGRSKSLKLREKTLQDEQPEIELVCAFDGKIKDEKHLHNLFADKRLRGEWFALAESDVAQFKAYFR